MCAQAYRSAGLLDQARGTAIEGLALLPSLSIGIPTSRILSNYSHGSPLLPLGREVFGLYLKCPRGTQMAPG